MLIPPEIVDWNLRNVFGEIEVEEMRPLRTRDQQPVTITL